MYAIVNISGKQYKVEAGQQLYVDRLAQEEGDSVNFDEVLLTAEGDSVSVGSPLVSGTSISAKVLSHVKGDKVIVFHKKRRKGYRKKNGHRHFYSKIEIQSIGGNSGASTRKASPAVAAPVVMDEEE